MFYFALTLFTSATLLFLVQPMIGKMILPRLGGTPAVWNTCMVFFQAVLLLGYGYTHFVSTRVSRRGQLILQALLLATPFVVLPFALGSWTPPDDSNPVFSVLGILLVVVGVPFFVVSTSAPLLQKWFADTGHPSSKDPYFLYGASNLGSMLALALYPLVMEPNFTLEQQTRVWTWAYGFFAVVLLGCIAFLWKTAKTVVPIEEPLPLQPVVAAETAIAPATKTRGARFTVPGTDATIPKPNPSHVASGDSLTWPRRLRWIGLAAIPSSLMLGTTTYMTTDIAAIPFFWVLPLALYLMTFIFVFARWPVVWTGTVTEASAGSKAFGHLALIGCGVLIAIGILMHLMTEIWKNPLEFGLPHYLYLVAFFLFFVYWIASGTGGPHDFVLYFQPCFLLFLVLKFVAQLSPPTWLIFALHLLSFFFVTLMCHGELAKDRPASRYLTEFYLWMSVGGVLGGLFNALFAPTFFTMGVIEYPLAMILSCFMRPNLVTDTTLFPGDSQPKKPTPLGYALDIVVPLVLAGFAYLCVAYGDFEFLNKLVLSAFGERSNMRNFMMAMPVVAVLALAMRPFRFGLALALTWLVVTLYDQREDNYTFRDRGFFGMVKVRQRFDKTTNSLYNTLIHGGIDHGRQHVEPELRHEPCAYFHPLTGIGQVFMKLSWPQIPIPETLDDFNKKLNPYHTFMSPNWRFPASLASVANSPLSALVDLHSEPPFAVVGLGTGTLAAFAKPYQSVDLYEIDPLVYKLSQKAPGFTPPFTYLIDALDRGANLKVILGDGRLKMEKAPEQWYHIICLDAFSSDAIPVHLLTVDAVELYLKKLAPGGLLVFNATNRYVDIAGVLKDTADHLGLECWALSDWYRELIPEKYGTDFVMLRRNEAKIRELGGAFNGGPSLPLRLDRQNWDKLMGTVEEEYKVKYRAKSMAWEPWRVPENLGGQLWTDSYSNLLGVLRWGR